MSPNMSRLLRFAIEYPANWHIANGPENKVSVNALANRGLVKLNHMNGLVQFRLALPVHYCAAIDKINNGEK